MKYLAGLLLILSLQGCLYQSVNETELEIANQFCESHKSKVVKINSWATARVVVVCYNQERGYIDL